MTKPPSERASHWLQVRVTKTQKGEWVRASRERGQKLSEWVCEHLDKAAKT